nr:SPASM domain-containing protein [Methanococcus voltae]
MNTDLCILSSGLCVPCCYDLNGDFVMGDINNSTLLEVWNSEKYIDFRTKMFTGRRQEIEICRKCPM